MTRAEAIQKLSEENYGVAPGQRYEVARISPPDAWGVARCFYAIYGPEYPIDTGYIPEKLLAENARGNVFSAVARTPAGDVVGYAALYRSSSPNPKLYELGQYIVLPEYRHGLAVIKLTKLLINEAALAEEIEMVFGEAVCHHLATQKLGRVTSARDSAIEIGLMPAAAYPREEFPEDRVSTLLQFIPLKHRRQAVYFPDVYREWLTYILSDDGIDRDVQSSSAEVAEAETRFAQEYFGFAGVLRTNVMSLGRNFHSVVTESEGRFLPQGARVLQFFVNLGEPSAAHGVEVLRECGYFFGGFLPGWFGSDGLLMQKVLEPPDFRSIKLYSDRARAILEFIRIDMGRTSARL